MMRETDLIVTSDTQMCALAASASIPSLFRCLLPNCKSQLQLNLVRLTLKTVSSLIAKFPIFQRKVSSNLVFLLGAPK